MWCLPCSVLTLRVQSSTFAGLRLSDVGMCVALAFTCSSRHLQKNNNNNSIANHDVILAITTLN